jgi:membrane protease YdiL (CAAX protease family)
MKTEIFTSETGPYRRTWVWAVPFLVFVLFIVGQLVVLLTAKNLGLITRETVETYPTVLYLVIGSFSMAALLFALWIRLFERRSFAGAGLVVKSNAGRSYAGGYGLGLLMGGAVVLAVWLLGGYGLETESHLSPGDLAPILIMMFAFALQSGTEEFVFRGWMLSRIAERHGIWAGIIANSLLFTLMHIEVGESGPVSVAARVIFILTTFLFSVFLSLLVIREKSIWGAAAWHAAWNWIFIAFFALPTTGIELNLVPLIADLAPVAGSPGWLTGGAEGPEASIMTPLVLALGCLWLISRRKLPEPPAPAPPKE